MNLKIDNKKIKATEGQTILEIAQANGFIIPSLCHHPDLKVQANCRICVVEINNQEHLFTACSTLAREGMEIFTDSPRVQKSRIINLELLFAEHQKKCQGCTLRYNCDLLKLAVKYKIKINRFPNRKKNRKVYKFSNAVEIDGTQCIDCKNCVEVCSDVQKINYLKVEGAGINQEIIPVKDKNSACIYCGQCALHCPVTAAQEQTEWRQVEAAIKDKTKTVIVQFAPSIRVSLGEYFGF